MPSKVFQIGFNKCGTRTVHRFFELNGFRSVHWDHGRLARRMFRNLSDGRSLIDGYERFETFADMEHVTGGFAFEGYKLFPVLAHQFPDALFLLNTRDREDWVRSRFRHRDGRYAQQWKACIGASDDASLADFWRAEWERHHERVMTFFAGRNLRFLAFDISRDSPALIAGHFPDRRFDLSAYRIRGKSALSSVS
jgi:hypothetical protein